VTGLDEDADEIRIETDALCAAVRKRGYVSGVAGGSFLDKRTGFHDPGFGLDIVDWLMEPGSDEVYRTQLPAEMVYDWGNPVHGHRPKRCVEGPQICTQAKQVAPQIIQGADFVAVQTRWTYHLAAPNKRAGSVWEQTLVFPHDKRYFLSCDAITTVNASGSDLFLRLDMPGHIRHDGGDTFSEVYLSYGGVGRLPSSAFFEDFAPDVKFGYRREESRRVPKRFIRAYRLRDPQTGKSGPWLAGMTLLPCVVTEAWCHQRGYVCFIEEIGPPPGRPPLRAGDTFRAAFLVGYFDSLAEMNRVYDQHAGYTGLVVVERGWRLTRDEEG